LLDRAIPENLKKYEAEILAGIAAAERRKTEFSTAWGYPTGRPAGPAAFTALEKPTGSPTSAELFIDRQNIQGPGQDKAAGLQSVKFWPVIGIAAARRGYGGAWRAWTLAKNLDKIGLGAIPLVKLESLARELGIHPKTWRRWMAAARHLGLIRDTARGFIVLAGQAAAAVIFGCDNAGTRPASIAAGDLVGIGWQACIWAAYEQTHGGRLISRARQENLTGVPGRTQRYYDSQAGVDRRANYAITERPGDELAGMAEFEDRPGSFKFYDKKRRRLVCGYRLPDSRTASAAESLQRGRSKKIAKQIKRLAYKRNDGLSILGQASSYDAGRVEFVRLFNWTGQQLRAENRKLARSDKQQPKELYLIKQVGRRSDLWQPVPLGGFND
jgi:hypothetical protein